MENNKTLYRQVMDLILTARPGQPIYPVAIKATLKLKTTKNITKILNRVAKNPNNRYGLRKYKAGVYYSIHNKGEKYEGLDGEVRLKVIEHYKNTLLFDIKTGKRIGFECGHSYYNRIGLTTQVPRGSTIVTNKPGLDRTVNYTILSEKSKRYVTGNNFKVLRLLYVIEHLNEVMSINEWWLEIIKKQISMLTEREIMELSRLIVGLKNLDEEVLEILRR